MLWQLELHGTDAGFERWKTIAQNVVSHIYDQVFINSSQLFNNLPPKLLFFFQNLKHSCINVPVSQGLPFIDLHYVVALGRAQSYHTQDSSYYKDALDTVCYPSFTFFPTYFYIFLTNLLTLSLLALTATAKHKIHIQNCWNTHRVTSTSLVCTWRE